MSKSKFVFFLDGLYLLWLLLSLVGLFSPVLAPLSFLTNFSQRILASLFLLCGFAALIRYARCPQQGLYPWLLCLPAHAVRFLIESAPTEQKRIYKRTHKQSLAVFLALSLQFGLLVGAASTWKVGESPKNTETYLLGLLHRIDVWFLSVKGIEAGLAILESSTVEVGALVYGSVSLGKAVEPILDSLERIGNILFYGRLLLTGMQVLQKLGQHYAVSIMVLLLALSALEVFLPHALNRLLRKFLLLLRIHLVLFLLLSLFFEPSLQMLDNLLQKTMEQEYLAEDVLAELGTEYSELPERGWMDSVRQWLTEIRAGFQDLGRKLFYFAILAVLRTIVLPLLLLFLLYVLYRILLRELLKGSSGNSS